MEQREEINVFINRELGEWAAFVLTRLSGSLTEKGVVLTGETLRSLQFELLKASAENVASLKLIFQESGRMRDMKALYYKKMPPVSVLEEFVREVGVDKFRYVPGYQKSKRIPTESEAVRRIAWGIAQGKLRVNKMKPKKWFARPFYQTVNVLIENLTTRYAEAASKSIVSELTVNS